MILIGMVRHSQSFQNSKFAMSLQYLKKEVRNGLHFLHADKRQSFHSFALLFMMKVARQVQNKENRKLQTIKKKLLQLLLCSIVM